MRAPVNAVPQPHVLCAERSGGRELKVEIDARDCRGQDTQSEQGSHPVGRVERLRQTRPVSEIEEHVEPYRKQKHPGQAPGGNLRAGIEQRHGDGEQQREKEERRGYRHRVVAKAPGPQLRQTAPQAE